MKKYNPFNIRRVPRNKWLGKVPSTGAFESFKATKYGIRAFILLIATYRYKYGITRLDDIITRYAPPFENNTSFYIDYVADEMNVHPSTEISCHNLYEFSKAMAYYESNYKLTKEEFEEALNLINK